MIEKITDQNLERYDSRLKEWCDRKFFEKGNYGKYETTEEANAVAFYPAPNTPLEGKVKFSFKETMPVNGEKGPENPSTIEGIDSISVTRCGKNFFDVNGTLIQASQFTIDEDGFLEYSGTNNTDAQQYKGHYIAPNASIQSDKEYTLVTEIQEISNCSIELNMSASYVQRGQLNTNYVGYNAVGTYFKKCTNNNIYNPNCLFRAMIAGSPHSSYSIKVRFSIFEGTVDSSNFAYVPYEGSSHAVSLNDTYYGGILNINTGLLTVTYASKAFDGTENWQLASNVIDGYKVFFCTDFHVSSGIEINDSTQRCTHYPVLGNLITASNHFYATSNRIWFVTTEQSIDNFKAFLAQQHSLGTPVTVVCRDESQTIQLAPTQILSLTQQDKYTPRLNTVYTNADSVQISYLKSPIRDEYEKTQAILSLGGNS